MSPNLNDANIPELKQQAIAWLVRLRADNLSEDEVSEFANWLAEDCLHSEAFAYAEDLFDDMVCAASSVTLPAYDEVNKAADVVNVVSLQRAPTNPVQYQSSKSAMRRKTWLPVILAMAAVWLFALILVMPENSHPLDRLLSDYHTVTGELREIQLADGSRILLNTNSAVSVDYDNSKRQITLLHGQAGFTVAKDSLRPFEVRVDDLNVTALGTVFEIYRPDADEISVTVQQHAVRVDLQPGSQSSQLPGIAAVSVHEGQRLRYLHDGKLHKPEQVGLGQATAWQQHRLLINDRPLAELITELNRYRVGRIFLSDAKLSSLRVTGVFSLDNPDDIVRTVCEVLGLQETRLGPFWVLLHY